jgi:hypothetical protein
MVRGSSVAEPLSPLQTIALIYTKLDQGVPTQVKIQSLFDWILAWKDAKEHEEQTSR